MQSTIDYIATLPTFLMYFATAVALMAAFLAVYVQITPYREFAMIREGNIAPAITLSGSLLGFMLPLTGVIQASISLMDMAIWGVIALVVQVVAFFAINLVFPNMKRAIREGQASSALLFAGLSVAVGMLNKACLSY